MEVRDTLNEEGKEMQVNDPIPSEELTQAVPLSHQGKLCKRATAFYFANEFIVLVIISIILAKAYPPLGADYLKPQITASWIAVILIFCKFCLGKCTRRHKSSIHSRMQFLDRFN
jgi:sodium/bile acid cotransporter 7